MKTVEQWLDEYDESHQNGINKILHWICVPLIVLSLLGLLWPISISFGQNKLPFSFNWAVITIIFALLYYALMSWSLAIGMFVVSTVMIFMLDILSDLPTPLWMICLLVFVVAWIGQFIGHQVEGKRPSFFKDLQFLLIGPLWLLSYLYRKLGIPY